MSIKTTVYITRKQAITRILFVWNHIIDEHYTEVKKTSFEDLNIWDTLYNYYKEEKDIRNCFNWTNRMLEEQMDKPYFRYSMFENYIIKD